MTRSLESARKILFPPNFVWGVAASGPQTEGAAYADGRGRSNWDAFSDIPGKILDGSKPDIACDFYNRYQGDIDLFKSLGVKAYRFSISWPRILPEGKGRVETRGLDFYDKLVDSLLAAEIKPWVVMNHWDIPQALGETGGWTNRDTADYFAELTDLTTRRIGDRVKNLMTINEPWCPAFLGYADGILSPGKRDFAQAVQAAHVLLLAHGKAVPIIRANSKDSNVGIPMYLAPIYPASSSEADKAAAKRYDGYLNRWFLDALTGRGYPQDMLDLYGSFAPEIKAGDMDIIAAPLDFMGENYNSGPTYVENDETNIPLRTKTVDNPALPHTGFGWMIYPQGLYEVLARLANEYSFKKLYVTENGSSFPDFIDRDGRIRDTQRTKFMEDHIEVTGQAIADGIPVEGFFVWSPTDNWEWAAGYTQRFGLTHIDFLTLQRTIKNSGYRYGEIIRNNSLGKL